MHALRDSLNDRARAYASRLMWGVSLGVAGGAGVYWYLAYIHFSWVSNFHSELSPVYILSLLTMSFIP
jgi:hypothetical protein